MDKFKFTPEIGFRDGTEYPNPASESETREQLQRPLDQLKNYINEFVDHVEENYVNNNKHNEDTFYDLIPLQTLEFKDSYISFGDKKLYKHEINNSPYTLDDGEQYFVEWDGKVYDCTAVNAKTDNAATLVGSQLFYVEEDFPFMFQYDKNTKLLFIGTYDTNATHEVRLYQRVKDVVNNIYTKNESDSKYQEKGDYITEIPSEYVTEEELEERISNFTTVSSYNELEDKPVSSTLKDELIDVLPSTTAEFVVEEDLLLNNPNVYFYQNNDIDLKEGRKYKVNWDGVSYELVANYSKPIGSDYEKLEGEGYEVFLGNRSIYHNIDDTGEPFYISVIKLSIWGGIVRFFTKDTSSAHTISLQMYAEDIEKLNPKFLPDTINLDNFYTKKSANVKFQPKGTYLTRRETLDICDDYQLAMYDYVDEKFENIPTGEVDLSDYYTKTESDGKYQQKGNYLTSIPSEYVTETELDAKGYLTQHQDLSLYLKTSVADSKYQAKGTYLTSIPSEYITESELNTRLENLPSGGVSSWNDLTDKPFYVEAGGMQEVFPTQELQFVIMDDLGNVFHQESLLGLEANKTYKVTFDNTVYECTCVEFNEPDFGICLRYLGNGAIMGFEASEDPFVIMDSVDEGVAMIVVNDELPTHTVGIQVGGEVVHTLDPKFLPKDYLKDLIDEVIGEALDSEV